MRNRNCPLYNECPVGYETCAVNCETFRNYQIDQDLINAVDELMMERYGVGLNSKSLYHDVTY